METKKEKGKGKGKRKGKGMGETGAERRWRLKTPTPFRPGFPKTFFFLLYIYLRFGAGKQPQQAGTRLVSTAGGATHIACP